MAPRWQQNYQIYLKYLQNIALLYQNKQDIRIYTELLLSLITIAVFGVFAIRPTLVTIAELSTEINGKQQTLDTMDQKIKNLTLAQEIFETERQKISILASAIPQEPSPDKYIRQIEGIAKKSDVSLKSINVEKVNLIGKQNIDQIVSPTQQKPEELPSKAQAFAFSVIVSGSYNSIRDFFSNLQSMRRPIFIDSMTLGINDIEEGSNIQLTASGRITFLKEFPEDVESEE